MRAVRFFACIIALVLLAAWALPAAAMELTVANVFAKAPLWGAQPSRVVWTDDGSAFAYILQSQEQHDAFDVLVYDVRSHRSRVLISAARFGAKAATPSGVTFSPDGAKVAFTEKGVLYVVPRAGGALQKIADRAGDPQWSPRGDALAYVRAGDVYVARPGQHPYRVTAGGKDDVLTNGDLDWVYPEELGITHGYRWSPDGASIAYLRMDERRVTRFPLVDFLPNDNTVDFERYPLAGEHNPGVELRAVAADGSGDRLLYNAAKTDEYVAAFDWKPRSQTVVAEIADRRQQHLRTVAFDGTSQTVLSAQSSVSWLNVTPLPRFLPDGRSVWLLEGNAANGLYVRDRAGHFKALFAKAAVLSLPEIDERRHVAYITAAYPTRRDRSLLAVSIDDGSMRVLTPGAGTHAATLSPHGVRFVVTSSRLNDPDRTDVVETQSLATTALTTPSRALKEALLETTMLDVDSRYGKLDATMLLPPNFDRTKRYPVVVYVYGGPAAPTTADSFGGQRALYHQLLARAGFIVFSIDGPGSQIDDRTHQHVLLHNFGPGSLAGQEIGAKYLATLPYVDASRIGIWGWSFGGYETCYAMTHSSLFKAGAAVAPVTDWHLYDSIYTERYMGLPRDQRSAYAASSVLDAASHLHGPLLIQHGTADDNVHMANSIALLQKFVEANDPRVRFYAYARGKHSIDGLAQRRTLYERMLNFWKANL